MDHFMLNTQVVLSKGIQLLVELAADYRSKIKQPAIATLHHLTATNQRFRGIMMRATDDAALLQAVESGGDCLAFDGSEQSVHVPMCMHACPCYSFRLNI